MDQVTETTEAALRVLAQRRSKHPPIPKRAIEHMGTITTFVLMLAVIFALGCGCYELFRMVTS